MMKAKDLNVLMSQLAKESEPMWLTNKYVDTPCIPFCMCYVFLILCMLAAFSSGMYSISLDGTRDEKVWSDPIQIN